MARATGASHATCMPQRRRSQSIHEQQLGPIGCSGDSKTHLRSDDEEVCIHLLHAELAKGWATSGPISQRWKYANALRPRGPRGSIRIRLSHPRSQQLKQRTCRRRSTVLHRRPFSELELATWIQSARSSCTATNTMAQRIGCPGWPRQLQAYTHQHSQRAAGRRRRSLSELRPDTWRCAHHPGSCWRAYPAAAVGLEGAVRRTYEGVFFRRQAETCRFKDALSESANRVDFLVGQVRTSPPWPPRPPCGHVEMLDPTFGISRPGPSPARHPIRY